MLRGTTHALIAALMAFAFLSAATASAWGLQPWRMAGFISLLSLLAMVGWLAHPRVATSGAAVPLALLAVIGVLILQELVRPADPMGYKIALPVLALLLAPRLALLLDHVPPVRTAWAVLSAYVLATAVGLFVGGPDEMVRGDDMVERWDATGSVITHGNICAIYVVLAVAVWRSRPRGPAAILVLALGLVALAMAFLSGTRTVLVIWGIYLALTMVGDADDRRSTALLLLALMVAFLAYSFFVNDSLALRLVGASTEFTSGRADSITAWLARYAREPFGIGLGGVRAALADGRPELDGERLLEWPHNEFVRLLVEAGPVGLLFAVSLTIHALRCALAGAARLTDPLARALLRVLAADVLAEMLLQNYLNGVYQATVVFLLIGVLSSRPPEPVLTPLAAPE